jgi:hypothetical protein
MIGWPNKSVKTNRCQPNPLTSVWKFRRAFSSQPTAARAVVGSAGQIRVRTGQSSLFLVLGWWAFDAPECKRQ